MCLKVLSAASATLLLSLVCIHGASAEGGCGPGFHRGPYGGCRSRTCGTGRGGTGSRSTAGRLRRWNAQPAAGTLTQPHERDLESRKERVES
jgi:hypothetical protein